MQKIKPQTVETRLYLKEGRCRVTQFQHQAQRETFHFTVLITSNGAKTGKVKELGIAANNCILVVSRLTRFNTVATAMFNQQVVATDRYVGSHNGFLFSVSQSVGQSDHTKFLIIKCKHIASHVSRKLMIFEVECQLFESR